MNPNELQDWLDNSDYLMVADVNDGDKVILKEIKGFVESYGKKKLQILVEDEKTQEDKLLNLNKFQAQAFAGANIGAEFELSKVSINGGSTLAFKRL